MRCCKKQIPPLFSKYRFHNESASSHRSWANADLLWKRYFKNCHRISFFATLQFGVIFFGNEGQLRPPITLSGHGDSPGTIQYAIYRAIRDWVIHFFRLILVIFHVGSPHYISATFFKCFGWLFLHEILLKAIDIENIGCLEPFLPLWEHFQNRVGINYTPDPTPRHNDIRVINVLLVSNPEW